MQRRYYFTAEGAEIHILLFLSLHQPLRSLHSTNLGYAVRAASRTDASSSEFLCGFASLR